MKNIILLSTILAAGTLAANAGETLTTTFSTTITGSGSNQTVTLTATNSINTITSTMSGVYKGSGSTQDKSLSWLGTAEEATPWLQMSNNSYVGWTITNTYSSSSGASAASTVGEISTIYIELVAFKDYQTIATTQNMGTLDVTATVYDGTTSKGTFTGSCTMSQSTASGCVVKLTSDSGVLDTSNFSNDLKIDVAVVKGGTWGDLYVGMKTMTIPEPSMFGLLAGTLALGLAGTRRRRRGNVK